MPWTGRHLIAIACTVVVATGLLGCGGTDNPDGVSAAGKTSTDRRDVSRQLQTNALGRRELPEVRRLLNRLIDGVNRHDSSICTQVYTTRYRDQLMRRKGAASLTRCRKEVARVDFKTSLVRIERVQIRRSSHGELNGQVVALERIGRNRFLRVNFGVVRRGGGYRIDSARGKQLATPPKTTPLG